MIGKYVRAKMARYSKFSGKWWTLYMIYFLTIAGLFGYMIQNFLVPKEYLIVRLSPKLKDTFAKRGSLIVESASQRPVGAAVSEQKVECSRVALHHSDKKSQLSGKVLWRKNNTMSTGVLGSDVNATVNENTFIFIYSESAILQYANAIHEKAQTNVDIGHGPCIQRLPQCIIIGNFKCGTRELIDFMSIHPRIKILSKPIYELEFFTFKYSYGLEWYRRKMPCSNSNQITIVKTPSYFQSTLAPGRIHAMNSSVRLIVLIREPVSRTISHFTFHENRESKFNYSLKKAVIDERTGDVQKTSIFINHSIYDEGMERYLHYFNRSQIKVIDSNDFKRDPYTVLHELEDFLNLEHIIQRANIVFNENKGYHCLRQDIDSNKAACYESDRGRNSTNVLDSIRDVSEVSEKLKEFFKPHNDKFFDLMGQDFDWYQ